MRRSVLIIPNRLSAHPGTSAHSSPLMVITAIPAFRDNYIWALRIPELHPRAVVLVDPGEPGAILSWLASEDAEPAAVLITHHHDDHAGALSALCARWPKLVVHGPRHPQLPQVTHPVGEGDQVYVPALDVRFDVLATPGHTLSHLCYLGHGCLFSGDTLFSCGCGRLFEGSPAQMHASLERLARLPDSTLLYCAHEYTLPNIGFAREVDPDNADLTAYYVACRQRRKAGQPTLPSNLGIERACNPFLRCHLPAIQDAISQQIGQPMPNAASAFAALRAWKDVY